MRFLALDVKFEIWADQFSSIVPKTTLYMCLTNSIHKTLNLNTLTNVSSM